MRRARCLLCRGSSRLSCASVLRLDHFRCTETTHGTLARAGTLGGKRAFTVTYKVNTDCRPLSASVPSACPELVRPS
eukprot:4277263-Prymnesium_polylepis.1